MHECVNTYGTNHVYMYVCSVYKYVYKHIYVKRTGVCVCAFLLGALGSGRVLGFWAGTLGHYMPENSARAVLEPAQA